MSFNINLLIVDDEKIILEGLSTIDWCKVGISNVYLALNGKKALEIVEKHDIRIVITDIKMPGIDGIELGKRIKEVKPSIKIIILSGYNDFEYAKNALHFGANDFLLKPVDFEELINSVKKAILEFEVDTIKTIFKQKSEQVEELGIALDEHDKMLLKNYDGLLIHDRLFFYDESIPKTKNGFSIQILSAINYINLNYQLNLTADTVAEVVKRSKNYFSTQFKKEVGITFVDYLNRVRIEHAKILLEDTSYLTYEIAEKVGYSEYRYFCTVFKKYTDDTPKNYREKNQTKN